MGKKQKGGKRRGMIHSENGRIKLEGTTEQLVDDLTLAMTQVLSIAKCRDRQSLLNIGLNISSNAVDILLDIEKEKANDKV